MSRIENGQKEGFAKLEHILTRNAGQQRATADGPAVFARPRDLAEASVGEGVPTRKTSLLGADEDADDQTEMEMRAFE
eukprot:6671897-Karenia_brevis.AAC.1